jgi:hypothetical protein
VRVLLNMYTDTYHGSTLIEGAAISKREIAERVAVLRRALGV